jgi:hypothetical protein
MEAMGHPRLGLPVRAPSATTASRWHDLFRTLAGRGTPNVGAGIAVLDRALSAGAVPFEAVVGAPWHEFGARLTLDAGAAPQEVARALGIEAHRWGPPAWAGLRLGPDGAIVIKPYHRAAGTAGDLGHPLQLPAGMPGELRPVMAAEHRGTRELYARLEAERPWSWFAGRALELVGHDVPRFGFAPHPRPAASGFGLGLTWTGALVTAVTVYAGGQCLDDDAAVRGAWLSDMDEDDRRAYALALAGVSAAGPAGPRGQHAICWWTFTRSGARRRAVSLRLPPAGW